MKEENKKIKELEKRVETLESKLRILGLIYTISGLLLIFAGFAMQQFLWLFLLGGGIVILFGLWIGPGTPKEATEKAITDEAIEEGKKTGKE